jgi:myo-inositol-1(or 4)-monophosphatase
VLDPIDGTSNFLHGIPHFAVSIAVQEAKPGGQGWGEVTQGLVYQPLSDESFWAEKGRGAWLNERRLRVSSRRNLDDALVATGVPYKGHGQLERFQRILEAVSPEVAGIRRFGSAALDLAWVAAGRYDGFWEEDLQFWDVAAGILLVREAGGFVTDFRGSEAGLAKGQVLAGNDQIHSRLHKLVAGAVRG